MRPDDWLTDDPFVNPDDPRAAERERRRREREEQRAERRRPGPGSRGGGRAPPVMVEQPPPEVPDAGSHRRRDALRRRPPLLDARAGGAAASGRRRRGRRPGRRRSMAVRGARRRWPARASAACSALVPLGSLPALPRRRQRAGSKVTIPKGASVSEVADILDEDGVVSSSALFQMPHDAGRQALRALSRHLHPGRTG